MIDVKGDRKFLAPAIASATAVVVLAGVSAALITSQSHKAGANGSVQAKSAAATSEVITSPIAAPSTASTTTPTVVTTSTSTTANTSNADLIAQGDYVDSPPGRPSYVLAVTASTPESASGNLDFLYQDGRVNTIFPISISYSYNGELAITANADASLTPGGVPESTLSAGSTVTATRNGDSITLNGCDGYLHWASTYPSQMSCTLVFNGRNL
ncbi:MAG: hypothetical protein M0019_00440 [Actinomycetota bacterium]|nr:hypothetical protein [Actinomycetota bacterium]